VVDCLLPCSGMNPAVCIPEEIKTQVPSLRFDREQK
jgi:hypothetical protein